MSLFAGEQPSLGIFSTTGIPSIYVPAVAQPAAAGIQLMVPVDGIALDDAVTQVNPTSATALMTYNFPNGSLNQLDRVVQVFAAGEVTTGAESAASQTFAVTLFDGTNTRTVATWTTGNVTASQTNLPWRLILLLRFQLVVLLARSLGMVDLLCPLLRLQRRSPSILTITPPQRRH